MFKMLLPDPHCLSHSCFLKGSRQPCFSVPDYICTGSRDLLGACSFRIAEFRVPLHPLLVLSNHSRSVSSSCNTYLITLQICFSNHTSRFLLYPTHPGPPTIPARTLLNPSSPPAPPTRSVTAQMGLGHELKLPVHRQLY